MLRSIAATSDDKFLKSEQFWTELSRYNPRYHWEPTAEEELERIKGSVHRQTAIRRRINSSY